MPYENGACIYNIKCGEGIPQNSGVWNVQIDGIELPCERELSN